jgi:diguanylate cyclase (GGDEF)-like protein
MLLDINQFKMYNDSLGNEVGDALLRQIAERLSKVMRDTDALARLGGDEFGIVLPMVQNAEKAVERIAKEVMNCLRAPFSFEGRELCVSSAIGIALFPQHGNDAHTLVSHADSAMYRAKWNSMSYLYYQPQTSESASEHLQFSGQLHGALERNEFELLYQPKVDLSDGSVHGAEALLRWQHPQEGLLLPNRFIPVAEQLGMITPITDWVLETALLQSKTWSGLDRPLQVSVNISARSFQSAGLVERIRKVLGNTGVEASSLEVEVTESTLMSDLEAGIAVLKELAELGVSIAIDDFGTGRFSMCSLKQLPVNTLKIDNSFLSDLSANPDDAAIVRSIIELGHSLGCKVVAEGVEDEKVSRQLLELGCDLGQGYYISKPLSQGNFNKWLGN